jgi:hypothetical protein
MLKEIRSWGLWSLGLGALHIIASGFFSSPWGFLLLIVGLGSYFFQSASMFIIYAVTLTWAALSNLMGGNTGWIAFALLQIYFVFRISQQYRRFRAAEKEYAKLTNNTINDGSFAANRAARFFPWIGSLLGCSSLIGLVAVVFIIIVIVAGTGNASSVPNYFGFIEESVVNLGVLGFAIGLAALLSSYRPKALAIIGLVASVLTLAIELVLLFA